MILLTIVLVILVVALFIKQNKLDQEVFEQRRLIKVLSEEIKSITDKRAADEALQKENAINKLLEEAEYIEDTSAYINEEPLEELSAEEVQEVAENHLDTGVNVQIIEPELPVPGSLAVEPEPTPVKAPAISAMDKLKQLFNNENWVGVNLFNRLGALLIIVGTIAVAAFEGFPPILRTSILFALALGVIGLGEFMNRKKTTIVSLGVSATGVALTYVAIAASFFALETLNMYAALIACIAATALGIFLATRYKAQVIGCFALIGGYLPIFSLDPLNEELMAGMMVYFVLLSLFSLALALTRKWSVMNIIGFALTVIGVSYIGWQASPMSALVYACFAFLLYTALPLVAAYRTKENFSELDVWLIILNTFISSVVIFLIAYRLDIYYIHAYLCLAFALIYGGAAFWVKRVFSHKNMQMIFTLTSIAFCVLFVPFYLDERWFAVAWLVQAAVLACYGILQSKKIAEYSGLGILLLSVIAFLTNNFVLETTMVGSMVSTIDLLANSLRPEWQFTFDYTFFTIGVMAILGCYFIRNRQWHGYEQAFKIASFANLWVFALYIIFTYILGRWGYSVFEYLIFTSWAAITFILAYLYCKVKFWADRGTHILANIIHFVGILGLCVLSILYGTLQDDADNIRLIINLFAAIAGFALVIYYYLTEEKSDWIVAYKSINIMFLWLLLIWTLNILISDFFGMPMILVAVTFAVAFVITRIPAITDNVTHKIAIIMYAMGLLGLGVFNFSPYSNVWGLMALNAVVQLTALIALNDIISLSGVKNQSNPFRIMILSSYFLLVVTQTMMVQGDVAFNSAIISVLYAVAAFAWIIVGFKLKNKPMRKAGLFLSMAAVAKLLIIDTWGLSTEMRIVSYISFGLILMLISFVYQKLSKQAEE